MPGLPAGLWTHSIIYVNLKWDLNFRQRSNSVKAHSHFKFSEVQNPKSKIHNPKSKIHNPKSIIQNPIWKKYYVMLLLFFVMFLMLLLIFFLLQSTVHTARAPIIRELQPHAPHCFRPWTDVMYDFAHSLRVSPWQRVYHKHKTA